MRDIWARRIPTLLGIFLISIGIGITTFLVNQGTIFRIGAAPSNTPKNINITNISQTSFTVSWLTDEKVIGSINFGETKELGQTALDERDQLSKDLQVYNMHSVTIQNLSPSTNYYFSITSGADAFLNNGEVFAVKTGEEISENPPDQIPLSGKVITAEGGPPTEGILYLSIDGAQKTSILLKSDGTYLLPLNSLRDGAFSSYFPLSEKNLLNIEVFGNNLVATAKVNINQIDPVPLITLSQNYDFSENEESEEPKPTENIPNLPTIEKAVSSDPTIENPSKDEKFSDQQPEFSGSANPNESVSIEIHSDENIKTQVTSDSNGNWAYRPTKPLSPGEHTITVTTKDKSGILKKITRSFTVFAAGDQVSESATPSATPIFTPTPTPTGIPIPTPTIEEVLELIPTQIASPSPSIPPTGNSSTLLIGIISIALTALGFFILLSTRGKAPI